MTFDELAAQPGAKVIGAAPSGPLSFDELAKQPGAKTVSAPEGPGRLEAFGRGGLQGATLGLGDEGAGAITAGIQGAANLLPKSLADRLDVVQAPAGEAYRYSRDLERERNKAADKAHGGYYLGGNVAGGLVTAPLLPGIKAAQGAGTAAKVLTSALNTGAQGAAFGAGLSEADLTKGEVGDFAKDVGKYGAAGGVLGAGTALAGRALGGASNYFAGKATDAADRAGQMAKEQIAKKAQSIAGEIGGLTQKGSRFEEQFLRYLEDPTIPKGLRSALVAWKASPESSGLIESVLRHQLTEAPKLAPQIAAKQAALREVQEGGEAAVAALAKQIGSPAEALRQIGARAKRYVLPLAGAALGSIGGPGAGAVGYFAGGGARPAQHALRRMLQHPAVAGPLASAAEGVTGAMGRALGASAPAARAAEADIVPLLFPRGPRAMSKAADNADPDILQQLAMAEALRKQREGTP